jgi:hypothetical protein
MRRTLFTTAIGLALLTTITSCSSSEGGTATPDTSSSTASTSAEPSPARPSEIRLNDEDPCLLMTVEQLAEIGETTAPRPITEPTFDSPSCNFNATGASWSITTVLTEGAEAWTSGKRKGQASEIESIAGYPAITITLPTDDVACDIVVDVADGQYLYAGFEVSPSFADRFPKPCDGARQVAEAAMENLTG